MIITANGPEPYTVALVTYLQFAGQLTLIYTSIPSNIDFYSNGDSLHEV
jgi:hypothetical protein